MPLLPETPVLGLLLVPPPPRTPRDPAPTLLDPPGSRLAKLWLPLAKPPLLDAAVPLVAPTDLLLAATPPPVPADLPTVAYGAG